jgi:hypothetical protein
MTPIERRNQADAGAILEHLQRCDDQFTPPLSSRVNLKDYAAKLALNAERFEIFDDGKLVALVAMYLNPDCAFISNVSV